MGSGVACRPGAWVFLKASRTLGPHGRRHVPWGGRSGWDGGWGLLELRADGLRPRAGGERGKEQVSASTRVGTEDSPSWLGCLGAEAWG